MQHLQRSWAFWRRSFAGSHPLAHQPPDVVGGLRPAPEGEVLEFHVRLDKPTWPKETLQA